MPVQVASLFGVLSLKDEGFTTGAEAAKGKLTEVGGSMREMGSQMTQMGGALATIFGPAAAGFGAATASALEYDRSMTNVAAILGLTREEQEALGAELRAIGGDSLAGPQAVASAFYDIVSGVADASTHMAILDASIATSEAGQADLQATTSALISTMNAYGFEADEASRVSDVFTRTVGMGVLTMDDLARALPQVTGLAAQFGVDLDEAAGSLAYMTTQGFTASESATSLRAMITTLLNPTEDMKDAIAALGFESGQALLEAEGLTGAYQLLSEQNDGLAGLVTNQEALKGSVILTQDAAQGFLDQYVAGIDGATQAARDIQTSSPAATFDQAKARVEELGIALGEKLLPVLADILESVAPLIEQFINWIDANPELVATIGLLVGAGGIAGGGLIALGMLVSAGGTLVAGLAAIPALLAGPVAPILAIGAAIGAVVAQVNEFNRVTTEAAEGAGEGLAAEIQSGAITIQDAKDEFFRQAQAEHGDFLARIMLGQAEGAGLFDKMFEAGNNATVGLSEGVTAGTPDAEAAAADMANATSNAAANALGTQSPSTVFREFGVDTVAGLAVGITAGIPLVVAPMAALNAVLLIQWNLVALTLTAVIPRIMAPLDRLIDKLGSVKAAAAEAAAAIAALEANHGVGLEGRQHGGPVTAGVPYVVGEAGPELFVPGVGGQIVPNGGGSVDSRSFSITIMQQPGESGEALGERLMRYLQTT